MAPDETRPHETTADRQIARLTGDSLAVKMQFLPNEPIFADSRRQRLSPHFQLNRTHSTPISRSQSEV
jgi:hypothetical protein